MLKLIRLILRRLRQAVVGLILFIVVVLAVFIGINQFDEKLNPEFETFLQGGAPPVPDAENGYFAAYAIAAPASEDIVAWGKRALIENDTGTRKILLDHEQKFIGDSKKLNCWTGVKTEANTGNSCATEEELQKMISDNQWLLSRYVSLYRYQHFSQVLLGVPGGVEMIQAQELLMAKLVLDAKHGKGAESLQAWIENMRFIQRVHSGKLSIVGQAIALVIKGISIKAYPMIAAHMTPAQLVQQKATLDEIFNAPTFGAGGWDIAETMRFDFKSIITLLDNDIIKKSAGSRLFYQPDSTKNGFYDLAHEMIEISKLPASEANTRVQLLKLKYKMLNLPVISGDDQATMKAQWKAIVSSSRYNSLGKAVITGMASGSSLLLAAHSKAAQLRLLKLYTEAKIAGIKPEDMAAFVATAPADMQDPFTNKPFTWNAEKHSIIFTQPDGAQEFEVVY